MLTKLRNSYFYNNPYPESVIKLKLFRNLLKRNEEISDKKFSDLTLKIIMFSFILNTLLLLLLERRLPSLSDLVTLPIFSGISIYDSIYNIVGNANTADSYTSIYIIFSIIIPSFAIFIINNKYIPKKTNIYSGKMFLLSILSNFFIALLTSTIFTFLYKLVIRISMFFLKVYTGSVLLIIILVMIQLFLNFAMYFCAKDVTELLISCFLVPFGYYYLAAKFSLSNGPIMYIILNYIISFLFIILDKIGITRIIMDFIIKWCYVPKYIVKMAFCIIIFCLWLINHESKQKEEE